MSSVFELVTSIQAATRVYVIGNGGSYANCMHIVNDLLASGVKAFTIDPATLSAFANDYGWDQALERWIRIVWEPGDLVIAMSGSGRSRNILNVVTWARANGIAVVQLFGNERHEDMQEAEESQINLFHKVRACLQPTT